MSAIHGDVDVAFEPVAEAFRQSFDGRPQMGAALAIRVGGREVVDLWGGMADARVARPWDRSTPSVIFSGTKGLASILIAHLVEQGRIAYEARVIDYWPEFEAAGKEWTTVADLMAHRAGLSAPRVDLTVDDIVCHERMAQLLAAQEPLWVPGTGYAYHALTHGWLAGELVRRVVGKSIGEYFHDVLAGPGVDAWIGLPAAEQGSVAYLVPTPGLTDACGELAALESPWPLRSLTLGGAFPVELAGLNSGFNDPRIQAAEIPGAGGIGTARAIAAIWSSTVVETDGRTRVLTDDTIRAAIAPVSGGEPLFGTPGPWGRWGMGFQLESEARSYVGPSSFGHDGAGGQVMFADLESRVGFAYITNQLEAGDDRAGRIVDRLRECLGS